MIELGGAPGDLDYLAVPPDSVVIYCSACLPICRLRLRRCSTRFPIRIVPGGSSHGLGKHLLSFAIGARVRTARIACGCIRHVMTRGDAQLYHVGFKPFKRRIISRRLLPGELCG